MACFPLINSSCLPPPPSVSLYLSILFRLASPFSLFLSISLMSPFAITTFFLVLAYLLSSSFRSLPSSVRPTFCVFPSTSLTRYTNLAHLHFSISPSIYLPVNVSKKFLFEQLPQIGDNDLWYHHIWGNCILLSCSHLFEASF